MFAAEITNKIRLFLPKSESPIFNISLVSLSARAIPTELAALLAGFAHTLCQKMFSASLISSRYA